MLYYLLLVAYSIIIFIFNDLGINLICGMFLCYTCGYYLHNTSNSKNLLAKKDRGIRLVLFIFSIIYFLILFSDFISVNTNTKLFLIGFIGLYLIVKIYIDIRVYLKYNEEKRIWCKNMVNKSLEYIRMFIYVLSSLVIILTCKDIKYYGVSMLVFCMSVIFDNYQNLILIKSKKMKSAKFLYALRKYTYFLTLIISIILMLFSLFMMLGKLEINSYSYLVLIVPLIYAPLLCYYFYGELYFESE